MAQDRSTQVEKPLIDQLTQMGWTHLEGAPPGALTPADPAKSARTSFSQIFFEERLKAQLKLINRGPDGKPWLDDRRISQAVGAPPPWPRQNRLDRYPGSRTKRRA